MKHEGKKLCYNTNYNLGVSQITLYDRAVSYSAECASFTTIYYNILYYYYNKYDESSIALLLYEVHAINLHIQGNKSQV